MNFSDERNPARWFIIISSLVIVALILWNTSIFFESLKQDERDKMEIWAAAQAFLAQTDNDTEIALTLLVLNSNTSIPTIWVDENGNIIDGLNIDEEVRSSEDKLLKYLDRLKEENEPIEMELGDNQVHRIYYGDSPLLTKSFNYGINITVFC